MKYLTIFLLVNPTISFSCDISCPELNTLYASSNHVFVAKASEVKKYGINLFKKESRIKVKLESIQNIKGNWQQSDIKTVQNKHACQGVGFKQNVKYIAFVNDESDFHFCNTFPYTKFIEQKIKLLAK